jgi:hypothetical protein
VGIRHGVERAHSQRILVQDEEVRVVLRPALRKTVSHASRTWSSKRKSVLIRLMYLHESKKGMNLNPKRSGFTLLQDLDSDPGEKLHFNFKQITVKIFKKRFRIFIIFS